MAGASKSRYSAAQALQRLKDGNQRFVDGKAQFPTVQKDVLADLARGQQPYATVLGCSDSRVPPELLFDAGFGELFVIRVAGNVLGTATRGSLQYAAVHLHTPLFVVLGHEGCGAVEAAIAEEFRGAHHRSRISALLAGIRPALAHLDPTLPDDVLAHQAVEANVRETVRLAVETPEGRARMKDGLLQLVGAVYDIKTGVARFLE